MSSIFVFLFNFSLIRMINDNCFQTLDIHGETSMKVYLNIG